MVNGIAILGLKGGGKSTLSHALVKKIGYYSPVLVIVTYNITKRCFLRTICNKF